MERVTVFDYPATAHVRRHGPFGYQDYASYRDWLPMSSVFVVSIA